VEAAGVQFWITVGGVEPVPAVAERTLPGLPPVETVEQDDIVPPPPPLAPPPGPPPASAAPPNTVDPTDANATAAIAAFRPK
jgi:hypothetical protein